MKIALLGSAPSSRLLAPFDDPSWEIWTCSPANMDLPRSDAFFEIHAMDTTLKEPHYKEMGFIEYCKKHPRVYMQEQRPEFPNAVVYPKDEMVAEFGPYFWKSSLDYMFALAISMKPEVIGLWGVDMAAHDEYAFQRPGCQHYAWEAYKRGIKLETPPESDILIPAPMYGYREASHGWWKMNTRYKELAGKRDKNAAAIARLQQENLVLEGAMDDVNYVCNTFDI